MKRLPVIRNVVKLLKRLEIPLNNALRQEIPFLRWSTLNPLSLLPEQIECWIILKAIIIWNTVGKDNNFRITSFSFFFSLYGGSPFICSWTGNRLRNPGSDKEIELIHKWKQVPKNKDTERQAIAQWSDSHKQR